MAAYLSNPVLLILPSALLFAAFTDLRSLTIPNRLSIALIALFPIAAVLSGLDAVSIAWSLLAAPAVLVVGFGLFALRVMGGGDAKLLAAAAPWFGLAGAPSFLLAVAMLGGVFTLMILIFRRTPVIPFYSRHEWLFNLHQSKQGVPYAVAIAAGGLLAFPHSPMFAATLAV